jgi:hypothetical protein
MIQSIAESLKTILGALWNLLANYVVQQNQPVSLHYGQIGRASYVADRFLRALMIFFIFSAWLCIMNGLSKNGLTFALKFF